MQDQRDHAAVNVIDALAEFEGEGRGCGLGQCVNRSKFHLLPLYLDSNTEYSLQGMDTVSTGKNTVLTSSQIRMARAALKIGVRDLAKLAGVAPMTVSRLENDHSGGLVDTMQKIKVALEEAGIIFIDPNEHGPGVRLRRETRA